MRYTLTNKAIAVLLSFILLIAYASAFAEFDEDAYELGDADNIALLTPSSSEGEDDDDPTSADDYLYRDVLDAGSDTESEGYKRETDASSRESEDNEYGAENSDIQERGFEAASGMISQFSDAIIEVRFYSIDNGTISAPGWAPTGSGIQPYDPYIINVASGTTITFEAAPNLTAGFSVKEWYINGAPQARTDLTLALTITEAMVAGGAVTIAVEFDQVLRVLSFDAAVISATAGGSPISSGAEALAGVLLSFVAAPASPPYDTHFILWTDTNLGPGPGTGVRTVRSSGSNTASFTMPAYNVEVRRELLPGQRVSFTVEGDTGDITARYTWDGGANVPINSGANAPKGASVTFTAPDPTFANFYSYDWAIDGDISHSISPDGRTLTITDLSDDVDVTVTLVRGYTVQYNIMPVGAAIDAAIGADAIISSNTVLRRAGAVINLTASPPANFRVYEYSWSVNAGTPVIQNHSDAGAGTFTHTLSEDVIITAGLVPGYTVAFDVAVPGTGSVTATRDAGGTPVPTASGGFHREGTSLTLTANANPEIDVFSYSWISHPGGSPLQSGSSNIYTISSLNADADIRVNFTQGYSLDFAVAEGPGSVDAALAASPGEPIGSGAILEQGVSVVLTAAPGQFYRVKQWTVAVSGGSPTVILPQTLPQNGKELTVTIDDRTDVRVYFEEVTFSINPGELTVAGHGSSYITPSNTVGSAGNATGTITLDAGDVSALPGGLRLDVSGDVITVISEHPLSYSANTLPGAPLEVRVTREGVTQVLKININMPFMYVEIQAPDIGKVEITNSKLTGNIVLYTNATGNITLSGLPAGLEYSVDPVPVSPNRNMITITGSRPLIGESAITFDGDIHLHRGGVSESFRLDVSLTPPPRIDSITPDAATISAFRNVSVHGTPPGAPSVPPGPINAVFQITGVNFDSGNEQEVRNSISLGVLPAWVTSGTVNVNVTGATTAVVTVPLTVASNSPGDSRSTEVIVNTGLSNPAYPGGVSGRLELSQARPISLTPSAININNQNRSVSIGAAGSGVITYERLGAGASVLPDNVWLEFSSSNDEDTIVIKANRPAPPVDEIKGVFTVRVTRDGLSADLTIDVELTALDIPDITWPTGMTATFGDLLSMVSISDYSGEGIPVLPIPPLVGFAVFGTERVPGTFSWASPSGFVGNAGTRFHSIIFTPENSAEFATISSAVSDNTIVTVSRAIPTVSWPTGLSVTYADGQTLADVSLTAFTNPGGTPGSFSWTASGNLVGNVPDSPHTHNMSFTPTDSGNFYTAASDVTVTVNRAVPELSHLNITLPDDLPWDGNPRAASVEAKAGVQGMGAITVYYSLSGVALTTQPSTAPGTVQVTVNIAQGSNFNARNGLSVGSFEIIGTPVDSSDIQVNDVDVVFTGGNHQVSIIDSAGGAVYFSESAAGPWTLTNPQYRNATVNAGGTVTPLTVYFRVIRHDTGFYPYDGVATVTIAPLQLNWGTGSLMSHAVAQNKVYDGNAAAIVQNAPTLSGVVSPDNVSVVPGSLSFAQIGAGTGIAVNATGWSIGGDDAGNYLAPISQPLFAVADITPRQLSWNIGSAENRATVQNKTYDGTAVAAVQNAPTLSGIISSDVVTVAPGTLSFAQTNAGTNIAVTATGWGISGADAGNYIAPIAQPLFTGANIAQRQLTWDTGSALNRATAQNKVYDGTATATVQNAPTLSGVVLSDNVTIVPGTLSFAQSGAGTDIPVTAAGWNIGGTSAGNYIAPISQPLFETAAITAFPLTGATVTIGGTYTFTELPVIPQPGNVSVYLGGFGNLTLNTHFTISGVTNNISAGNAATVTVTGMGNFTGTASGNFTIAQRPVTGVVSISSSGVVGADGRIIEGTVLTAEYASVIGVPGGSAITDSDISFQWYRNGSPIGGATGFTYIVGAADPVGTAITVRVTGFGNYSGTLESNSAEVGRIPLGGVVAITGTPELGNTLSLDTSLLTPVGAEFEIVWLRNGVPIDGETGVTLTITQYDLGATLTATVIGDGDFTGTLGANMIIPAVAPTTAPQSIAAAPGDGQVTLTWSAPPYNGGSAVTGYEISTDGGVTWADIGYVTAYTVTGLTNGTTYTFLVRAANEEGSGPYTSVEATPVEPPQIISITPTAATVAMFEGVPAEGHVEQAVFNVVGTNLTEAAVSAVNAFSVSEFSAWKLPSNLNAEFVDPDSATVTLTLLVHPNNGDARSGSLGIRSTITGTATGTLPVLQEAVAASIQPTLFRVTVLNSPTGSAAPTGQVGSVRMFAPGTSVSLIAGIREGFSFNNWSSASQGVVLGNSNGIAANFIMPSNDVIITANWTPNMPPPPQEAPPNGGLTPELAPPVPDSGIDAEETPGTARTSAIRGRAAGGTGGESVGGLVSDTGEAADLEDGIDTESESEYNEDETDSYDRFGSGAQSDAHSDSMPDSDDASVPGKENDVGADGASETGIGKWIRSNLWWVLAVIIAVAIWLIILFKRRVKNVKNAAEKPKDLPN